MSRDNNKQKSWLVRVHQKIIDGMVDSSPMLAWARSKFGVASNLTFFAVLACNWFVIYGVTAETMPFWFKALTEFVLETIPGARANVQHSWNLRDVFPYIYVINLILGLLCLLVVLTGATLVRNVPFLNITNLWDILKFHCAYVFLGVLCVLAALRFYGGFWLEPVFEPKALPVTSAGGAAIAYRMYETRFGAFAYFGLMFGFAMPFGIGCCLQVAGRWYLSAFKTLYLFLLKKEL